MQRHGKEVIFTVRLAFLPLFSFLLASSLWWSCTKDSVIEIHKDTTIYGNQPPDYDGVSDDKIASYVNKLYIDLIGEAPSSEELSAAITFFNDNNLSESSREEFLSAMMSTQEYFNRFYSNTSNEFIGGGDSLDIQYAIELFIFLYYADSLAGNTFFMVLWENELHRLYALQTVLEDFKSGVITLNQFYGVFLNNYLYDEINMGSENFVKASFDDLFRRAPTVAELSSGVSMVDNVSSLLFLQAGDSKGDYVSIVTTCDGFYEGLVKKTFNQLLIREPSSSEMGDFTSFLKSNNSFQELEKRIMITDEYAGL